jgi:hypothetical protein
VERSLITPAQLEKGGVTVGCQGSVAFLRKREGGKMEVEARRSKANYTNDVGSNDLKELESKAVSENQFFDR